MSNRITPSDGWRDRAACAGMDTDDFYPEYAGKGRPEALDICDACPVRIACAQDAVECGDYWGIRGGVVIPSATGRARREGVAKLESVAAGKRVAPAVPALTPATKRRLTEAEISIIVHLRSKGWTHRAIADHVGVHRNSVDNLIRRLRNAS